MLADMRSTSTAVVTGASRGLGLALARALAAGGWNLLVDARGADALDQAVSDLRRDAAAARPGDPARVHGLAGDIVDPAHRAALARAAADLGGVDVLVLNAGALGPTPLPALADVDLGDLEDVLRTNAVAQLGVFQALRAELRAGARVLAITSDAAVEAYEGWGAYGASKAAFEQLCKILAVEHPDLAIHVVDPGDLRTAMQQAAFPGEDISDRPLPEESVPALIHLLESDVPSGRHRAAELLPVAGAA